MEVARGLHLRRCRYCRVVHPAGFEDGGAVVSSYVPCWIAHAVHISSSSVLLSCSVNRRWLLDGFVEVKCQPLGFLHVLPPRHATEPS